MTKLDKIFNDKELSVLTLAIGTQIYETRQSIDFHKKLDSDLDRELLAENLDDLRVLKSLYRRFFPNLSDDELFGKGGEADEK